MMSVVASVYKDGISQLSLLFDLLQTFQLMNILPLYRSISEVLTLVEYYDVIQKLYRGQERPRKKSTFLVAYGGHRFSIVWVRNMP